MSLRKIVEKKKAEKYAWPDGWMTREQAANDLGCTPRDVDDTLREAIRDGDIQKQYFSVWDRRQSRVVREPGYRVSPDDGNMDTGDIAAMAGLCVGRRNVQAARKPGTVLKTTSGLRGVMQEDGKTILWDGGRVTTPKDNTLRCLLWGM